MVSPKWVDPESGSGLNQYCGLYLHDVGEMRQNFGSHEESIMKVSDILRVKGNTLYTVTPEDPVAMAVQIMAENPLTCTSETELDEVRRMMLDRHARYLPVLDKKMLMGVISFYDVAKAV